MTEPTITIEEKPAPELRETIFRLLQDYNWSKVSKPVLTPCAISVRDPDTGAIRGGLWGASAGGWLFVEMVFVPEEFRKRGVGTSLMHKVEEIAAARQCVGVWLDTHTFQAPEFYEKLGYQQMGKLPDFPKGHDRIFYFKALGG